MLNRINLISSFTKNSKKAMLSEKQIKEGETLASTALKDSKQTQGDIPTTDLSKKSMKIGNLILLQAIFFENLFFSNLLSHFILTR